MVQYLLCQKNRNTMCAPQCRVASIHLVPFPGDLTALFSMESTACLTAPVLFPGMFSITRAHKALVTHELVFLTNIWSCSPTGQDSILLCGMHCLDFLGMFYKHHETDVQCDMSKTLVTWLKASSDKILLHSFLSQRYAGELEWLIMWLKMNKGLSWWSCKENKAIAMIACSPKGDFFPTELTLTSVKSWWKQILKI